MASVVEPGAFGDVSALGFENHLNLFHGNRCGLPEQLVRGLAVFLNTTAVDTHFRRFNGHTQVNATDLRLMKYPNRDVLSWLGEWAMGKETLTQTMKERDEFDIRRHKNGNRLVGYELLPPFPNATVVVSDSTG